MKKISRRNFLKAAPAAPLAVKSVADAAAAELTGIGAAGTGATPDTPMPAHIWSSDGSAQDALRFLLNKGLPEFKKKELWQLSKRISALDPDIASMRSFSHSGKMQMQRQRNYEEMCAGVEYNLRHSIDTENFARTGVNFNHGMFQVYR